MLMVMFSETASHHISAAAAEEIGAIQVLRNTDGVGWGVRFNGKSVTKV